MNLAAPSVFAGTLAAAADIAIRASNVTGDLRFTWEDVVRPAPFNLLIGIATYFVVHKLLIRAGEKAGAKRTALESCLWLLWPSLGLYIILLVLDYVPASPGSPNDWLWALQPVRLWCLFVLPSLIVFGVINAERGLAG